MKPERVVDSCWLETDEGIVLRLKVSPNASKTEVRGVWAHPDGARLKLAVKAPPVEGKANAAILDWAARTFGLKANQVTLIAGEKGKSKTLLLRGANANDVKSKI